MKGLRAADTTWGAFMPRAYRWWRGAADSALCILMRPTSGLNSPATWVPRVPRGLRSAAAAIKKICNFCSFFVFFSVISSAAETWVADHEPLAEAVRRLPGGNPPELAFEIATTADASRPVTLALFSAAPVARDQALAFAAGAWWAIDTDGNSQLTRAPAPPHGRLRADRRPYNLSADPTAITLVTTALAPWTTRIPGDAVREGTLGYDPASASWFATLDDAGHNRLLDVLTLLQTPRPQAPALLPDLGLPPSETIYAVDVPGGAWRDWCQQFATAVSANVSIDPTLAATIPPPLSAHGGMRDIQAALSVQGIASQCLAGTWCLGPSAQIPVIANREHPAQRSRLAFIPIPHLLQEGVTGEALAEALRAAVAPPAWTLPGWTLSWRPTVQALIVIADPPTIHAVLDALDSLDRNGPAAGMAALAPATPR